LNTGTDFEFGPDYLNEGYFYEKDGDHYIRPEILDSLAMDVAKRLGNQGMKSHQMRRFFNAVRGIETKLSRAKNFEAVKADITQLKSAAVYQIGREVVPEDFKAFIDRNTELAVESEKSFRQGFLQHFQSVLAFFVYCFRESETRRH
jgi:CRISPR type III-A-associated protein Csm2